MIRFFTTFAANALKQGMIFLHQGKYCEVVSQRQVRQGRGAASIQLEYLDLGCKKIYTLNYPTGTKVDKVDVEKHTALVQYVGDDGQNVIVTDHNYEDRTIPLGLLGISSDLLSAGDEIYLYTHGNYLVKVSLSNSITSKLKKR